MLRILSSVYLSEASVQRSLPKAAAAAVASSLAVVAAEAQEADAVGTAEKEDEPEPAPRLHRAVLAGDADKAGAGLLAVAWPRFAAVVQ